MKYFSWKWLVLIAVTSWSLMLVSPPKDKINLGLDLRGGSSFTLEVDTEGMEPAARDTARDRAMEIIRSRVDALGIVDPIIYPEIGNRVVVQIPGLSGEDRDRVVSILRRQAYLEFRLVHEDNDALTRNLFQQGLTPEGYRIVSVGGQQFYRRTTPEESSTPAEEEVRQTLVRRFHAPSGHELLMEETEVGGQKAFSPLYVRRRAELTGEYIASARVDYEEFGQPAVALSFDSAGTRRFREVTTNYSRGGRENPGPAGRRLAIVLDGVVRSAPELREPITGGTGQITGNFTLQEAQDLVVVLQAGSLPTPVKVAEERTVDPTLGKASIESGLKAIIIGGVAVVIFMLAYYMLAGVVANIALILDLLLLPLGMMVVTGFMGLVTGAGASGSAGPVGLPVLTLPGIAGIVLTIGMAVDANVLIFERIREEQRTGKRFAAAVSAGYDKAFSTVFDANITTLITALILFWRGSGPVRGFAVTLSAGIVVSMYTALVVTRMLFNVVERRSSMKELKMRSFLPDNLAIDFLGKWRVAAIASLAVIVIAWGAFFGQGYRKSLGIDFIGGTSIVFEFDEKQDNSDIEDALRTAGVSGATIQYQRIVGAEDAVTKERLEIRVSEDQDGEAVIAALTENFEGAGFDAVQIDAVGGAIGKELRNRGLGALLFAMIGIVLYISLRFEFAFAVGAIVAVLHDVLITVGLFCLFGRQLNLPIVAALLTIVGYSVNDTIVIFDRIREDLKLMKGKSYKDICNISINQTLNRTLLTSVTTLLVVTILLVVGGGAIQDFALTLFIGVIVGTYSSIFIAAPVVLFWHPEAEKVERKKGAPGTAPASAK